MAQTAQPTAKRVLLGREIAYVRTRAGVSQTDLSAAIGFKGNYRIAHLEGGRATITPDELELLMDKLGLDPVADADHRAVMIDMHRDSHRHGDWRTGYRRAYSENLRLQVDLERHANRIFIAQSELVPGLLQHEGYTHALASRRRLPPGITIEDAVQAWQARRKLIAENSHVEVHAVLMESAVRRKYASSAVMRQQMEHLIEVSHRHGVLLQILTHEASENTPATPIHNFHALSVPSPGRAGSLQMICIDAVGDIRYRDDPASIDAHELYKMNLTASALDPEDTRQFLRYISDTLL